MASSDEAAGYIRTHCPHLGSFGGDFSPYRFLARVAEEMEAFPPTVLFPERYKEHVAYAVGMVARHWFLEPPAAIAAVYLATRFEFFFRVLSGKLNADGTWINRAADQRAAVAALGKKGLNGPRVRDVAVTYRLMKLNRSLPVVQVFDALDKAILPAPIVATGNFAVADIGDRIAFGRHAAGHGWAGDISSEAVFYGLAMAIVFYNQT
jgi:hypothetical protein